MAIKKIKISELPLVQSLSGLFTIGYNTISGSVKVSLQFIKDSADSANTAATNASQAASAANQAAGAANTAASNANTARDSANQSAVAANTAAGAANTAATNANAAKDAANQAATSATQAAAAANQAAGSVNQAKDAASQAATAANQAATSANNAASSAGQAAASATQAATNANTKATLADGKATQAGEAAALANSKAQLAQETIARLEELAESLVGQYKLIPTGMELGYPAMIPYNGQEYGKITVKLLPEDTGRNVLFLPAGGDSVTVYPDGGFRVNGIGLASIHVIPTENTSIYRTIQIAVIQAALLKCTPETLLLNEDGTMLFI